MQKTYMAKPNSSKKWHLADAEDQILGRFAAKIATILMGKHHPTYTPHVDTGDFVVVINAEKIKVTGNKEEQKKYYAWSGYPSGLKVQNFADKQKRRPEEIISLAVRRMLPKTKLGRRMLRKLKVYRGTEHPHDAQKPQVLG